MQEERELLARLAHRALLSASVPPAFRHAPPIHLATPSREKSDKLAERMRAQKAKEDRRIMKVRRNLFCACFHIGFFLTNL